MYILHLALKTTDVTARELQKQKGKSVQLSASSERLFSLARTPYMRLDSVKRSCVLDSKPDFYPAISYSRFHRYRSVRSVGLEKKQEAFEKCWAHSPHAHSIPDVASGTVARRLRIDVHDNDDNDNA